MPPDFSVAAIVAAYNEADIVEQVVADLIEQGVQVYVLDDGSTDGTAVAVERFLGRGVLQIETLAAPRAAASSPPFDWERILVRKAQLAQTLDADWILHHDADEFRESPWRGVPLVDAIRRVDALGFNAIDFASLDFWPVHDRFQPGDDVRAAFTAYAERAPYDRVQVRCWKKTQAPVDLASSAGHDVQFPGRRVFPIRFISRHYPIRGQAHGERKVFRERRGRFRESERARGWHVQYDGIEPGASFIRDAATLTPYDGDAVRLALTLRHRGVEALETSLGEARCIADAQRRQLDAQRRQLDALQRQVEALQRQVDQLADALARTRDDLTRRGAEAAALRGQLDERSRELADTRDALAATRAESDARAAESDSRAAEIAAARDFLAHQAQTIDALQHAVSDGQRRLDALHRSLSWRWTAPVRAAVRALRGR